MTPLVCTFHLVLGGRSESLVLEKPDSLAKGVDVLETAAGAGFCPDQVLLSKTFPSRPGCRQKSLLRNSGVGDGGQTLILEMEEIFFSRVWRLVLCAPGKVWDPSLGVVRPGGNLAIVQEPERTHFFRNAHLFIILFVRNFRRVCSQFWWSVRNSVWGPFNRN